MANYNVTFSNWADVSSPGSVSTWSGPSSAQALDGVCASALSATNGYSDYLQGTGPSTLGSAFPANQQLNSIQIEITRMCPTPHPDGVPQDYQLFLVVENTILTAINFAAAGAWPVGTLTPATYTVTATDLEALGIGNGQVDANFGIALSVQQSSTGFEASVDQIAATFTTEVVALPYEFVPSTGARYPAIGVLDQ